MRTVSSSAQAPPSPQAPAAPAAPPTPAPADAKVTPPDARKMTVDLEQAVAQTAPLAAGVPRTRQEIAALKARRSELSNQLNSAADRREELASQLRQAAAGTDRAGLEQRIQVLDERIVRLETDIAESGRLLALAPSNLVPMTSDAPPAPPLPPGELSSGQITALMVVFILFVLAPLAFALARRMWKRATAPFQPTTGFAETADRLGRLEQAVDTIAIEIERVSEGQRFVTRLLSESQQSMPAVGVGEPAAEPMRARGEPVRVRRGDEGQR